MQMPSWMQGVVAFVRRARPRGATGSAAKSAGMAVNDLTALNHATFWACVNYIGRTVAGLEWQVYQKQGGDQREQVFGGAVDWMLNKQANPEMTAFVWRMVVLAHVLVTGNHYSEIQRDVMGRPLWLWPLDPRTVRVFRDPDTNELRYGIWQEGGGEAVLLPNDIYHVKGLGWDGILGYSVIEMARRSIGIGLAMDEYGGNFYQNGTHLGLIFEHPKTLSEGAQERFKKALDSSYTGPGKSFKSIVTEEGMKLSKATMTMVDAQYLEQRNRNAYEICQWMAVPPHKVGLLERATNNNIEHQSIEAVQDCIGPWCKALAQEADIKLFGMAAQRSMVTIINTDTLERGDFLSRMNGYKAGRDAGMYSVNDCLRMEKKNSIGPEGDMRLQPMNMVPLGTEPEEPAPPAAEPAADVAARARAKVVQMRERTERIAQ
jgi:HK97 family phage portal protein